MKEQENEEGVTFTKWFPQIMSKMRIEDLLHPQFMFRLFFISIKSRLTSWTMLYKQSMTILQSLQ